MISIAAVPRAPASLARKNLRHSTIDAGAFSVMVGSGETYLPAFALALGLGEIVSGLVASVPFVVGSAVALVTPCGVRRLRSHRKWVVVCAALQAFSFIPLVVAALVGRLSAPLLFLIAGMYWAAGQATGPAWNTWMEHLVPRRVRATYFARRTRVAQGCVLIGLTTGGFVLEAGKSHNAVLAAFALLFALAAVSRMFSVRMLAAQSEEPIELGDYRAVKWGGFFARLRGAKDGRLVAYMLVVQISVHLSAPYFSPFMLSEMRLSYSEYMALLVIALLARIFSLPLLGRLAHRFGPSALLWVGGVGIAPLSALWLVSQNLYYLAFVQVTSGFAWAAYELSTQLLFFEMIRKDERTSLLSLFNLANAVAMVLGALLGGALLGFFAHGPGAYMVIFFVSSVLRALTVVLLLRVARFPRVFLQVATRIIAVRPSAGAIDRPILPSLAEMQKPVHEERRR